jgi:hypothetical protein
MDLGSVAEAGDLVVQGGIDHTEVDSNTSQNASPQSEQWIFGYFWSRQSSQLSLEELHQELVNDRH